MVTGELRAQVDKVWDAFWSGGIANPVEVIEQITYLLFIKRLDELQTLAERRSARTRQPLENPVYPEGVDESARVPRPYRDLRWGCSRTTRRARCSRSSPSMCSLSCGG